jgi:hypothetical protein
MYNGCRAETFSGRLSIRAQAAISRLKRGFHMLEGVTSRVPAADHWKLFHHAEHEQPELISALAEEIRRYAANKDELNSTVAGREVLGGWTKRNEWSHTFPADGAKLFGMVMWVAMYDDRANWQTVTETVGGRNVRVYRRVAAAERFYVDLSGVPDAKRAALVAEIKEVVRRAST